MDEEYKVPETIYHTFPKTFIKLKELLPLIRNSGFTNYDELGTHIILCPEGEEWTWVKFNASSCFLDVLGDLLVEDIDTILEDEDDDRTAIKLWVKTDDYNWFDLDNRWCC